MHFIQNLRALAVNLRALAVLAALACAAPALAQTRVPAPAPAPAPSPAQTPAIPLDKLTAAQIAAGKDVVMLSGIYRTFNAFVPTIMQQIFNMVTPTRPEIRKDLEETLKALVPEYEKRTSEMVEHTGKLFASVMSEDDLKAAANFFKSPAGQKYVELQPRIIDQMVVAVDDWNRALTQEILLRARAEMKKKGKDM